MQLRQPSRILLLAPHTDDCELGAGGSISRWSREGHDLHYVAFSACETSVPNGLPRDVLRGEAAAATKQLGIPPGQVRILDFEVREFPRDRQAILQTLVELNSELEPDLVIAPSHGDIHQDHAVIAQEALRAFKRTSLLGYEIPWNQNQFSNTTFVEITPADVERKIAAIGEYRSQAHRPYVNQHSVESGLRFRGLQAGTEFAEAFEAVRVYL